MKQTDSLNKFLSIVVADRNLHARWLNTLSFLEYIGFRKIVKSQTSSTLCLATLNHAQEEGRHALLLKKLALKYGGQAFNHYAPSQLICGSEAEDYFQKLDRHCEEQLQKNFDAETARRMTYLYVTWLVEQRAMDVYGCYSQVLTDGGHPSHLAGLMGEETKHLEDVESQLKTKDAEFLARSRGLQNFESDLFHHFFAAAYASLQ